jgi:hypothetical protein
MSRGFARVVRADLRAPALRALVRPQAIHNTKE